MKNITTIVQKIIQELSRQKQTVTFAESCTGGRIAAAFTAVSGASEVLNGSCVTYSNEIKHQWLGVSRDVLDNYGAVSEPCVQQMLQGVQRMAASDFAIAVSGIAGPTGGTDLKPVGTVYIGLLTPSQQKVFHCHFKGSRESIQEESTRFAIEKFAELLNI